MANPHLEMPLHPKNEHLIILYLSCKIQPQGILTQDKLFSRDLSDNSRESVASI